MARETTGRFLGPISVNDFFELMPVTDGNGPPDIDSIHFNAVRNTKGEKHMYTKPLVRFHSCISSNSLFDQVDAMNSLKLPELEFFDTSNHPDCHCVDMKPDIGVYSTNLKPPDGVTTDFARWSYVGNGRVRARTTVLKIPHHAMICMRVTLREMCV